MAFEAIVRRYQHRVHALAYRLLYDAELARDVAQEVFLRLHQNLHRYDPERPFEPWFLRLATNYALNARQKALLRRTASLDAGREDDGPRRDPPDPGTVQATEAAAAREEREAVREAVRALPDKYAGVVALHYLEGLGVKDIAARLDLPAGTVKIRLHRARALLRERLARLRRQGDTR
ncbi:MAG: sigma-70 family RNA polymerase sigma factor [Planctomycetota bacterium]|nr:MAG: sigma-70 family RNA polymerase sigma factor [Planctomycetota bacterium]